MTTLLQILIIYFRHRTGKNAVKKGSPNFKHESCCHWCDPSNGVNCSVPITQVVIKTKPHRKCSGLYDDIKNLVLIGH